MPGSDGPANKSGGYGGGYLLRKYFPRTAMLSVGFAVVTQGIPVTADLVVPAIVQAKLEGYKYPARTVRQTEPQNGWLYTAANPPAFDITPTIAPNQKTFEGYTYPARTVRQTEFQHGWFYTAANPPAFDATITVGPAQQLSQSYRLSFVRRWPLQDQPSDNGRIGALPQSYVPAVVPPQQKPVPGKSWLTTSYPDAFWAPTLPFNPGTQFPRTIDTRLAKKPQRPPDTNTDISWIQPSLTGDVWTAAKFQNNSGERTPKRKSLRFRYPIASTGFSTDGSSQAFDAWDASKFQTAIDSRMPDRKKRILALDYHRFPFGLLDARPIFPAFEQLKNSYRTPPKRKYYTSGLVDVSFAFTALTPFDPTIVPRASFDRMRERNKRPIVTPDDGAWIVHQVPAFNPIVVVHSVDERLRDRYKKVPQLDQPSQAWIFANIPAFDPQLVIHVEDTRLRERYKKVPRLEGSFPSPVMGPVIDERYIIHVTDERVRDRYKKVPQLDQPSQAWITANLPVTEASPIMHGQAPFRMDERKKLLLQDQDWVWTMAWLHDVLVLQDTDLVVPEPEDQDPHFTRPAGTTPYWLAYPRRRRQWRLH